MSSPRNEGSWQLSNKITFQHVGFRSRAVGNRASKPAHQDQLNKQDWKPWK